MSDPDPDPAPVPARRRRLALFAALAVLAVLVVAIAGWQLGRSGHNDAGSGAAATHPTPPAPPGSLGIVDWIAPVLEHDGAVTVYADVDATPDYCLTSGVPRLESAAVENGNQVTITVTAYRPAKVTTSKACASIGHAPVPVTTRLAKPLGSRTLVDAATGQRHPVLAADSMPDAGYLPTGYREQPLTWDESNPDIVTRDFTGPNGQSLLLERRPLPDQPLYNELVLDRGTVLGHPARVAKTRNFDDNVCAIWTDAHHVWWACSQGSPRAALSPAVLLRIGNSVH
ncbi:MAG TPA: hypothetical protein VMB79_07225 [Jatrophihabitans sp.]|nr:hypothetical protein [Jatrophihabitans sp.]